MQQLITIDEAREQLKAADAEVARVKAKIAELEQQNSPVWLQRKEREMADALMAGGDIASIVAPPMNSSQVRHAIAVLQGRLAEAFDAQTQASGSVRRAKVQRLRELLDEQRKEYDGACADLMQRWMLVTVLAQRLDAVLGLTGTVGAPWWKLTLPRGVPIRSSNPWDDSYEHVAQGGAHDLLMSVKGNAARAQAAELLKREGVDE